MSHPPFFAMGIFIILFGFTVLSLPDSILAYPKQWFVLLLFAIGALWLGAWEHELR